MTTQAMHAEAAPFAGASLDDAGQAVAPQGEGNNGSQDANQGERPADEQRQPRERRSRDRYGRDRRERNGEQTERGEQPAEAMNSVPAAEFTEQNRAPAQHEPAPVATDFVAPVQASTPVAAAAPVEPVAPLAPLAPVTPVAAVQPVAVAAVAPVKAPAVAKPVAAPAAAPVSSLPKVQSYDLPMQDLVQVAQTSGLQWVNSDADKIAQAQAAIAAQPKPVHVPRERAAPAVSDEGPLVLVETRRDLGSVTLPFENTPG